MKAVWLCMISLLPRQSPPSSSRILIACKNGGESLGNRCHMREVKRYTGGWGEEGGEGPIKAFINRMFERSIQLVWHTQSRSMQNLWLVMTRRSPPSRLCLSSVYLMSSHVMRPQDLPSLLSHTASDQKLEPGEPRNEVTSLPNSPPPLWKVRE